MDQIDKRILEILSEDARTPVVKLAEMIGRSRTATQARLDRMERDGDILGYSIVRGEGVSHEVGSIIFIYVDNRRDASDLTRDLRRPPEVRCCHHVTGDASFALEVAQCAPERLREVITYLYNLPGVSRTDTVTVLETEK